jgi:hypothetical protein
LRGLAIDLDLGIGQDKYVEARSLGFGARQPFCPHDVGLRGRGIASSEVLVQVVECFYGVAGFDFCETEFEQRFGLGIEFVGARERFARFLVLVLPKELHALRDQRFRILA